MFRTIKLIEDGEEIGMVNVSCKTCQHGGHGIWCDNNHSKNWNAEIPVDNCDDWELNEIISREVFIWKQ